MDNNQYQQLPQVQSSGGSVPGKGAGVASFIVAMTALVLTVVSFILPFKVLKASNDVQTFTVIFILVCPLVAFVLSIVGIVLSSISKKQGYHGGLRGAGFGISLSFLIMDALALIAIVSCLGCAGLLFNKTVKTAENMYDNTLDHASNILSDSMSQALEQ